MISKARSPLPLVVFGGSMIVLGIIVAIVRFGNSSKTDLDYIVAYGPIVVGALALVRGYLRSSARAVSGIAARAGGRRSAVCEEPRWVRWTLIAIVLGFLGVFLVIPLVTVFHAALAKGLGAYIAALRQPDTGSALRLTLLAALIAVPLNVGFGIAAAWAITRFRFPGRRVLVTIIDLPFAVSPVIAGMMFVLLFGAHGLLGPWLAAHHIKIIFAVPAIVIVTAFVTIPFVARELIPALEARGPEQELAALTLGASPFQTFWRVTIPNLRWPLVYGAILCTARAVGEFGAVSVVSGHVRGETNTVPLHVEILYNDFQYQAAFAVATILVGIALVTLGLKSALEWRVGRHRTVR